jgi:hypothetical protein
MHRLHSVNPSGFGASRRILHLEPRRKKGNESEGGVGTGSEKVFSQTPLPKL